MLKQIQLPGILFLCVILCLSASAADAENYTETVYFNQSQGISYNYVWTHTLSNLPVNCEIESVEIEFRAKVWYWGWNIYEQNLDLLCSDTTVFNTQVFELTPATHPKPSNFYTKTGYLLPAQFDWVKNDGTASIL